MSEWNEITLRESTKEEREMYGEEITSIYDCPLPDDGQEVLITTYRGEVTSTTFYNDDCAYFDGWKDYWEVTAWMPLPEPFKKERKEQ